MKSDLASLIRRVYNKKEEEEEEDDEEWMRSKKGDEKCGVKKKG